MLLGFTLLGFNSSIPYTPDGDGCAAVGKVVWDAVIKPRMKKISKKTHENRPGRKFTVPVRACDEQTLQAYREVLKEVGYKIDHTNESSAANFGWRIDAVKDEWEDLEIGCWNVGSEKKKSSEIAIYSKSIYFPEEPKHYKEKIHQKALERLKIQEK